MRAPFQILVLPFLKDNDGNVNYAIFNRSDSNYWQGIAGGGEEKETSLEAARREAHEEAGILFTSKYYKLSTIASVPVCDFEARKYWPKNIYIIPEYYFAVEIENSNINISEEHTDYRWAYFDEAFSLLKWDNNKTGLWELNERIMNNDLQQINN